MGSWCGCELSWGDGVCTQRLFVDPFSTAHKHIDPIVTKVKLCIHSICPFWFGEKSSIFILCSTSWETASSRRAAGSQNKTKQSRAFKSITRCWERNNNTEKWIKKYVHYLSKINIKQIMLAILSVFFFCLLAFIVLCSSTKMLSSILTFHILLSNAVGHLRGAYIHQ